MSETSLPAIRAARRFRPCLLLMLALAALVPTAASAADALAPAEARAIAKEATIYGFPLVDNYRVNHAYFVDRADVEFKAPWNELHNTARVYTPEDKAIQTPNSDTPYSQLGMDLRAEPLVLTVPPDRQRPLFLDPAHRRLHLQFRLHRQPHHRERRRPLSRRRTRLEGRDAEGHQQGLSVRDRIRLGALSDAALRSRRHRSRQEDPGGLQG